MYRSKPNEHTACITVRTETFKEIVLCKLANCLAGYSGLCPNCIHTQKSYERNYVDGRQEGIARRWDDSGQLTSEETYQAGEKVDGEAVE